MLDIDPPAAPEGITMKLEQVRLFLMSAVYFMGYTICMFIGIGFVPPTTRQLACGRWRFVVLWHQPYG